MARKNKVSSVKILFVAIFINIFVYFIASNNGFDLISNIVNEEGTETSALVNVYDLENQLKMHVIDVGQGDAILLQQNEKYMLIDAGPSSSKDKLIEYMSRLKVKSLDYVVLTHTHEDHIGGMTTVINNYKIDKILMSKDIATSKTFENMVKAAKEKQLTFYAPTIGENFTFGSSSFTILSDGKIDTENTNNKSIVIKLQHGKNAFLFMGDAEEEIELNIINSGLDFKADVIKLGHHGSNTSNSKVFISAASPKYAIISVGKNNSHGHPCKSVMNTLKKNSVLIYRTDESCDIVAISDGNSIKFNVDPGSYSYISAK